MPIFSKSTPIPIPNPIFFKINLNPEFFKINPNPNLKFRIFQTQSQIPNFPNSIPNPDFFIVNPYPNSKSYFFKINPNPEFFKINLNPNPKSRIFQTQSQIPMPNPESFKLYPNPDPNPEFLAVWNSTPSFLTPEEFYTKKWLLLHKNC